MASSDRSMIPKTLMLPALARWEHGAATEEPAPGSP